ncbi:hypothetical protein LINPERHAP2_LOCUS30777 [Linum perenne]
MEPPEGPYTGYLVITDEEAESQDSWCCGLRKDRRIKNLPFPQDKILSVLHMSDYATDELNMKVKKLWFVPVLDRPLSSNCYYAIKSNGRSRKGQAYRSSRESDMGLCCFEGVIKDKKPKPFDYRDVYHQFKIHRHHKDSFFAKSLAIDGIPPKFLMKRGWKLRSSRSKKRVHLTEALGLDTSLRSHIPSLDFPIYRRTSPEEIVGKWYCPFMFIKEEASIKEQMSRSRVYRVSLEKYWQEIYSCSNSAYGEGEGNVVGAVVSFRVAVGRRADVVFGREAAMVADGGKGMVWFRSKRDEEGRSKKKRVAVGLNVAVVKKMKWVMEDGGWVDGDGGERVIRVDEEVEIGDNCWRRFSCYVMVESFVFRRMDGTVILK